MNDTDFAFDRLRGLIGDEQDPDRMFYLVHAGAPLSKNGTSHRTVDKPRRLELLVDHFRRLMHAQPTFAETLAVVAIFFRPNRQRIDADNMMKAVMDAGTRAGVWRDDSQITAQASFVEFDDAKPRTVIALCPYRSTLDRAPQKHVCRRCGKPFERPEWYRRRCVKRGKAMFCSLACARPVGLLDARCPRCEQVFQRRTSGQRYCSVPCARADHGKRLPNGEQRPPAVCEKCGARVSRREYRQCRSCRGFGRPRIS